MAAKNFRLTSKAAIIRDINKLLVNQPQMRPTANMPQQEWRKLAAKQQQNVRTASYIHNYCQDLSSFLLELSKNRPAQALRLIQILNLPVNNKTLRKIHNQNRVQNPTQYQTLNPALQPPDPNLDPLSLNRGQVAIDSGVRNGLSGPLVQEEIVEDKMIITDENRQKVEEILDENLEARNELRAQRTETNQELANDRKEANEENAELKAAGAEIGFEALRCAPGHALEKEGALQLDAFVDLLKGSGAAAIAEKAVDFAPAMTPGAA